MLSRGVDRAIVRLTFALACTLAEPVFPYVLPDPTFEVLKPQGLRVSIPGRFNIVVVVFFPPQDCDNPEGLYVKKRLEKIVPCSENCCEKMSF